MRKIYVLAVIASAALLTACAGFVEFDRARAGVSVLRSLPGEKSGAAAAEQLIADQAVLRIAEGNAARAIAALQALGVPERDARVRILAAQAATR